MDISTLSQVSPYLTNKISSSYVGSASSGDSPAQQSFADILSQSLEEVNSSQKSADQLTESFLAGGPVEIHQMLIAVEKADLALRQTVEIRNQLIDAYKQISNMQI